MLGSMGKCRTKVSTLFVFNLVPRSLTSLDDFFVQLPVDLYLIFEKSMSKNGVRPNPFYVYFKLEICRLPQWPGYVGEP